MNTIESKVRRLPIRFEPDPRRVLLRPFVPSLVVKPHLNPEPNLRVANIFSRVMTLDEKSARKKLEEVLCDFGERHKQIRHVFSERFEQIRPILPTDARLNETRCLLLGAYFTNEYSLESSALFNPSMVAAPDQRGLKKGEVRFYLSLRATGEGHISSITFRSGVLSGNCEVQMDPTSRFVRQPRPEPAARYELKTFRRKLQEMGVEYEAAMACTRELSADFIMQDILRIVRRIRINSEEPAIRRAAESALLLAESNYTVRFENDLDISEKILFPYSPSERNGIEDARFVQFCESDGSSIYYATYTAYDGSVVLPQMVATQDFQEFSICTLNGPAVRNKGLALFPRKIGGHYVMLGRQDSENIHIMFSDHLHFWHDSRIILRPSESWEFVQMGNCGSPIETPAGWLVLTHGVGPMRKYCIGAFLLDLDDPLRVIARLREPLLKPAADERDGYVPNVVYSCGGMLHRDHLILPYAVSDTASRIAVIPLRDLLSAMQTSR